MLVLQRQYEQSIIIDLRGVDLQAMSEAERLIEVQVIEIRGDDVPKVRIGFHAARRIPIHRKETFRSIERNGRKHQPNDLMSAAPRLLAVAQAVFDDLHDLPDLTAQNRKLLDMAAAALKIAEPDKFDSGTEAA